MLDESGGDIFEKKVGDRVDERIVEVGMCSMGSSCIGCDFCDVCVLCIV